MWKKIALTTPLLALAFLVFLSFVVSAETTPVYKVEVTIDDETTAVLTIPEGETGSLTLPDGRTITLSVTQATQATQVTQAASAALAPQATSASWDYHYESRVASATESCVIQQPGFNFTVRFLRRGDQTLKAVVVGRTRQDSHLRITHQDGTLDEPVELEGAYLILPARGDRLMRSMVGGAEVAIEWTDVGGELKMETASLEGFGEAYQGCVGKMGKGFD